MKTACATLVLLALCGCGKSQPDPSINFAEIERDVASLIASGTVARHDLDAGESYVNRLHWNALNVTQRKGLGYTLGYFHGNKNGTNTYAVNLMDNTTGKRLARWSKAAGYTGYE